MNPQVDVERVFLAHKAVRAELLAERMHGGHWVGQLASSPLATAAAITALVASHRRDTGDTLRDSLAGDGQVIEQLVQGDLSELLCESVQWLARHQNSDGGWGDCDTSQSNLAATLLVEAAFRMTGVPARYADLIVRADQYIAAQGGPAALRRTHAHDKTLVAAVLAHCALAGIVSWRQVPTLPFELLCLPQRWRQYVQVPYPRYATPALLAVGRAKFDHDPPRNPFTRLLRRSMRGKALAMLEELQSDDDSFLGSILLTAFVATSLASIGCQNHAIVQRNVEFLLSSVRSDASWPIETDHAVANTALALGGLAADRPAAAPRFTIQSRGESVSRQHRHLDRSAWQDTAKASDTVADEVPFRSEPLDSDAAARRAADLESPFTEQALIWLLESQRTVPDSRTNVPAGGWASSDAPGSLPNAAATAGVLLALAHWRRRDRHAQRERIDRAVRLGVAWLLDLQHDEGGWPTFYAPDGEYRREEGAADVSAQALRALAAWRQIGMPSDETGLAARIGPAIERGWRYLESQQQADGRVLPLWFGNEHQPGDRNPVLGTAQVLVACAELKRLDSELARRAAHWLVSAQHATGGWGRPRARRDYSGAGKDGFRAWRANEAMAKLCTIEETAMAVTALLPLVETGQLYSDAVTAGLQWLASAVEQDRHRRPAVVGFYPSNLWYHDRLYPLVFAAGALSRAIRHFAPQPHEIASVG